MTEEQERAPIGERGEAPALRVLGGAPAPASLRDGWRAFIALPEAARRDIWTVLGPLIAQPRSGENDRRFRAYCAQHGLEPARLASALEALHALLSRAGAENLEREAFAADLAALDGGGREAASAILAEYEHARDQVRLHVLQGSLADHGKLLEGIDWRLDHLTASDRGHDLGAPVLLLTLRYREGRKEERITLQLLPDTIRKLKQVCERFV